jgi:F-type H+-transporting ATPase subunit a
MGNVTEPYVYASVALGGKQIPFITDAVVAEWVIMAALVLIVLALTKKLKTIPAAAQNAAETAVEFVGNMCTAQIGHHGKNYAPYIGTVLLFLGLSNILSIFNIIPSGETLAAIFHNPALESFRVELYPPTKNFNVTLCLALMTMAIVVYSELRYKGFRGWLKTFYYPTPGISAFIKLLDYVVRPMSLCLRLLGNILGGFIVMELVYSAMPIAAPALLGVYFDLFDGGLQAYVFVFLTMVYLQEAVEVAEE